MAETVTLADRYRLLRTIGSGGMGTVYLVQDMRREGRVMALKTLKDMSSAKASPIPGVDMEVERFRTEFRSLLGVIHPNIPEMFDFGSLPGENRSLYFTSEFIDGEPLSTLRSDWTSGQLHVILISLCRALAFLHSRGLLHRDIKPENVLAKLELDGAFSTIKLVDFGLAGHTRGDATEVSGTLDYLAPELMTGGPASVASDIYALGMLMYRLATGRMPFESKDPLALARLRTTAEPPPPLRYRPDLPVGLSDVIMTLIRPRPDERPASARYVIALLNEREGTDFSFETPETRHAYLRSAESVTNVPARERLNAYVNLVRGGVNAPNVAILGHPGMGRKRLITDFASELELSGIPAQVIESDMDLEATRPGTARALLLPEMRQVSMDHLIERFLEGQEFREWWIVGADESDAEPTAMLIDMEAIHLTPMNLGGVRRFISAMLPENNFGPQFAIDVYTRSLGLAVSVQGILSLLLDSGRLHIGLEGWELLPGPLDIPIQPDVAANIDLHMALLPETSREIVEELACSRSPLPFPALVNLADLRQHTTPYILSGAAELFRNGWLDETSEGYFLVFRGVAEHVHANLPDAVRCEYHRQLTASWSHENLRTHPLRDREILFHDFYAGTWAVQPSDARRTLIATIEQGDTTWVRRLVEYGLASNPPKELRTVMCRALAEVEYVESVFPEAAEHMAATLEQESLPVSQETVSDYARYALIEEKLGHTDHAQEILQKCASVLNPGYDPNAGAVFGALAWMAFKRGDSQLAQKLTEEGLVRVPPKATDSGLALLLNTLGTLAFYRGDGDAARLAWKRCLEVYEEIHDRKGVANMYNNLGVLASQGGDRIEARALWEKCEEIAREIHDMHRLSGIYNNLGIDALESGNLQQAEDYYLKALTMFRRLKSPRDQVELLSNLGELSFYRADYSRAQAYWQEALQLAATVNDRESQVEPLVYMGKLLATVDDLEKAETTLHSALRLAHELSVKKGEGQAWEGLAVVHARRGNRKEFAHALQNAHAVLTSDVDPLACLHLHLTECGIAASDGDSEGSLQALDDARKVAATKWDPYTAARTLVFGLLFAKEEIDPKERPRVLRQLSVYPELLWKFHWACGRKLAAEGSVRAALEEYGQGVAVLKGITSRLSDEHRALYLGAPHPTQFKIEALHLRRSVERQ